MSYEHNVLRCPRTKGGRLTRRTLVQATGLVNRSDDALRELWDTTVNLYWQQAHNVSGAEGNGDDMTLDVHGVMIRTCPLAYSTKTKKIPTFQNQKKCFEHAVHLLQMQLFFVAIGVEISTSRLERAMVELRNLRMEKLLTEVTLRLPQLC